MSDFSDQLKAQADIVRIIGEHIALRRAGGDWVGLCPFHGEKTASFHVHPRRQFYYCFGCHAHGDVYRFLMELQKISFPEAVAAVAERMGVPVPRSGTGDPAADEERRELLKLHELARDFFVAQLRSPAGAAGRAYLTEREVGAEAAAKFQIGFAPDGGRALTQFLRGRQVSPALALAAGLCQQRRESAAPLSAAATAAANWDDLYDRFRGRVVFPIADERGKVIAFGARILQNDQARPAPKYLNSPETAIYTKGRVLYNLDKARTAIRNLGYFILVEGYLDCLSVFMAGFENVAASCGTALTSAQVRTLARLGKNAVVNFDPDTAGAQAAERSIGLLLEEGFQIRIVTLAGGLDPDLYIRRNGAAAYGQALQSSRPYFEYLLVRARKNFDLRRPDGKVGALNYLLPYLSRIQNEIERQQLAENLAAQLQVDSPIVSRQLKQAVRERRSALVTAKIPMPELSHAELALLRAWLEWDQSREQLRTVVREEHLFKGLPGEMLFETLERHLGEVGGDVSRLPERLEPSERRLMAEVLLGQQTDLDEATVIGAVEALRDRQLGERRRELAQQIEQAAAAGDQTRVAELLRQREQWNREHGERERRFEVMTRRRSHPEAAG